ncbi:MAG: 16S rRNA (cytosine(1402)-N(4))-methyltransferase, partial [Microgenomates group bacterium]
MHTPVLLKEVIEGLRVVPDGLYIDGTYGEGGHAQAIALKGGKVLGIDLDDAQVVKSKQGSIQVVQGNYAEIAQIAKKEEF